MAAAKSLACDSVGTRCADRGLILTAPRPAATPLLSERGYPSWRASPAFALSGSQSLDGPDRIFQAFTLLLQLGQYFRYIHVSPFARFPIATRTEVAEPATKYR